MIRMSRTYTVLVLILLIGTSLRLIDLGEESLWLDEVRGINRASGELGDLFAWRTQDPNPPLYYIMLKPWVGIFGTSEMAARSFSVIFGILCIPAAFLVASSLFDERTGLFTALLVAVMPFQIQYSQEARMYSLLCFLALLSTYSFLRVVRNGSRREGLIYILASSAMIYTHIFGLFVLVFQNAWMLLASRERETWKRWIVLQFVVLVIFLPWLPGFIYQVGEPSTQAWIPRPDPGTVYQSLGAYLGGREWRMVLFVSLSVLGLFSFTKISGGLDPRKPLDSLSSYSWNVKLTDPDGLLVLLLWIGSVIILPVAISLAVTPIFVTRYAIAATFPLYILIARSSGFLPGREWTLCLGMVVLVASASGLATYYRQDQKEQWSEVASIIRTSAAPGEPVFVNPPSWIEPFLYYHDEDQNPAYPLSENEGEVVWVNRSIVTPSTIGPLLEDVDGFWTIVAYSGGGYPRDHLDGIATQDHMEELVELFVFHYRID